MPIDPPIRRLAEAMAAGAAEAPPPESLDERRRAANATLALATLPHVAPVTVTDHRVPVDGGEITVRVTTPDDLARPMPTVLFIHGGGWFQGDLDSAEAEAGPLASVVPCLTVSVDYRLAPEHPFPIPLDDCLAAHAWLLDHADELGADPDRIVIGGTSAGANLTAALCLRLRDLGRPQPLLQLLDAPCLDLTLSSPSMEEHGHSGGLDLAAVREFADWYRGDTPATDPRVSPLHEPDLRGLAPALINVCELDPVRDDGERYLAALHEADVPAACLRALAQPHGGWIIPFTVTHRLMLDVRAAAIRRAFEGSLVP